MLADVLALNCVQLRDELPFLLSLPTSKHSPNKLPTIHQAVSEMHSRLTRRLCLSPFKIFHYEVLTPQHEAL